MKRHHYNKKKNKKKERGFFRKWSAKLHLWLGLSVGILIFIISITGALYVFKDDIENFTRKEYIYHKEQDIEHKQLLPIRTLEAEVNRQVPEKYPIYWVNIPIDKKMSYRFYWYEHDSKGWNYFNEFPIYKVAYVNPYSGKVLKTYNEKNNFFQIIKMIHWSFLLKTDWGKYLVGIPTIVFLVMLITGIILWYPRNKAARKQRFWFRWKNVKNWRRKNYDFHNIIGFYISPFALIFSITGLLFEFFIVRIIVYVIFSGGNTVYPDFSHIRTKTPVEMKNFKTLDKIADKVRSIYPDAYSFNLNLGHSHLDVQNKHFNYEVYVKHLSYSYHKMSNLIFDENSGELLHTHDPKDKDFGEKVVTANYDIHTGDILGLPTKIIAFLTSLAIASMPITGFFIWRGRRKKNKYKQGEPTNTRS